jgi:hypothetical protein
MLLDRLSVGCLAAALDGMIELHGERLTIEDAHGNRGLFPVRRGALPGRATPRPIICRIAVSRISTSVVYVDLRSPFGGWSYVRIVILWGPSAHVSGPVRLVWRRWPSSPVV